MLGDPLLGVLDDGAGHPIALGQLALVLLRDPVVRREGGSVGTAPGVDGLVPVAREDEHVAGLRPVHDELTLEGGQVLGLVNDQGVRVRPR